MMRFHSPSRSSYLRSQTHDPMRFVIVFITLIALCLNSCVEKPKSNPEPHLELGQEISFPGSSPDKSYLIIGYRRNYDGPVEKEWNNQDYVVFIYINDNNDVKQATIHKISVIKR
jgi:hypothetical protein